MATDPELKARFFFKLTRPTENECPLLQVWGLYLKNIGARLCVRRLDQTLFVKRRTPVAVLKEVKDNLDLKRAPVGFQDA